MTFVLDNYDSFTFNLVQYLGELGEDTVVERNDAVTVEDVVALSPDRILVSPGPCSPDKAGVSLQIVRWFGGRVPVLGVCLGHQAIGQAFGGRIVRADRIMHGKTSPICHDGGGVFAGLPAPFIATRYHSLVVDRATLPDDLEVSAWTEEGEIMGLRHKTIKALEGVQFHPESILSEHGHDLLANFLGMST